MIPEDDIKCPNCSHSISSHEETDSFALCCNCALSRQEAILTLERDEARRVARQQYRERLEAEAELTEALVANVEGSAGSWGRLDRIAELEAQLAAANETIIELRSQLHMLCDIGDNLTRALDAKDGEE